MAARFTFARAYRKLVPWWLSEGEGGLVLETIGIMLDATRDRTELGTLYRFPEYAPADALALLGQARRMRRGIGETQEAHARRLLTWREFHKTNGNPFALLRAIRTYLNRPVRVRTVDARGNWYTIDSQGEHSYQWGVENWNWDGAPATPEWAKFWVIIYSTGAAAPWRKQQAFGSGLKFGVADATLGTTATPGEVDTIRTIISESALHAHIQDVIIAFDDFEFDPTAPEPDGTWGNYSQNVAGVYRRTRSDNARYWHWKDA